MSAIVSTEYKLGIKKIKMEREENRKVNLQKVVFMIRSVVMSQSML